MVKIQGSKILLIFILSYVMYKNMDNSLSKNNSSSKYALTIDEILKKRCDPNFINLPCTAFCNLIVPSEFTFVAIINTVAINVKYGVCILSCIFSSSSCDKNCVTTRANELAPLNNALNLCTKTCNTLTCSK